MTTTMSTRSYYQEWYAERTPAPYDDMELWHRYAAALERLIASLDAGSIRALEVGSGGGQLQHLLPNYVAIDLAASAGRFMDKPFLAASATALPFADQSFDLVWSVWTLEHVIAPERMLAEMLRVTRPGGALFLCAGWWVADWAGRGYHLGSWRGRSLAELILRVSVPPRRWFGWPAIFALRLYQFLRRDWGRLWYRFLKPNYSTYFEADADASIQIDPFTVMLWFLAHGAVCTSHPTLWRMLAASHDEPLVFRVTARAVGE